MAEGLPPHAEHLSAGMHAHNLGQLKVGSDHDTRTLLGVPICLSVFLREEMNKYTLKQITAELVLIN